MIEISCTRKCGVYTKYQDVHLLDGRIVRLSICLDRGTNTSGRTVYLKGGNVNVVYDGQKWVEYNPCGVV